MQIDSEDWQAVRERVVHAAGPADGTEPPSCEPITGDHLVACEDGGERAILGSLGPIENVDRLAAGQQLRFAGSGITLIYGENGSGKSGYARIAKCLCRSLSIDKLQGNAFSATHPGPPRVKVRYKLGDNSELRELDWTEAEASPLPLRQISVFDARNARLYVDEENRIAYLPAEIDVLEHHGLLCTSLGAQFQEDQSRIEKRIRTPLPGGYTPDSVVQKLISKLDAKKVVLPTKSEIESLAGLTSVEEAELADLDRRLAQDPVAMAAQRRRAKATLSVQREALALLENGLSTSVETTLQGLIADQRAKAAAATVAADAQFGDEPLPDVGGDVWRALYEAARRYATQVGISSNRLPDELGTPCPLCHEPLSHLGADRLRRFNAFVEGEASRLADLARSAVEKLVSDLRALQVPAASALAAALQEYGALSPDRAARASALRLAVEAYAKRRKALVEMVTLQNSIAAPAAPANQTDALDTEINDLEREAATLEASAHPDIGLEAERARLATLKDRARLKDNLGVVLERLFDLEMLQRVKACRALVNTTKISNQITAMRRKLVADGLQQRIQSELTRLALGYIPFQVMDFSQQGRSLFSVGLRGVDKINNSRILSEGEQRAVALACFLAETSGQPTSKYGLIIDDPVCSLDQFRIRKIAERLVEEAGRGRQVIIFTHNLVFFNEIEAEAARFASPLPLIKMVIRKSEEAGFGVVEEDADPWITRSVDARINDLRARSLRFTPELDFDSESYRRRIKDFYSDLRETWERLVEELLLYKTIERLVPDVKTQRLRGVQVEDSDYKTIYFAMKRVSERSGHDMSTARAIPEPTPEQMKADLEELETYRSILGRRRKETEERRKALEASPKAVLV